MSAPGRGRPTTEVSPENHFGTWLRGKRKEKGLSGESLSFLVDGKISQSSISHYERGTKKPEIIAVFLLSRALEVDPTEALAALLEDIPELKGIGFNHVPSLPADRAVMLGVLTNLPEDQWKAVRALLWGFTHEDGNRDS